MYSITKYFGATSCLEESCDEFHIVAAHCPKVEGPGTFSYYTTARAENMEVLPAELHAHVDAIDIEEGLYF